MICVFTWQYNYDIKINYKLAFRISYLPAKFENTEQINEQFDQWRGIIFKADAGNVIEQDSHNSVLISFYVDSFRISFYRQLLLDNYGF